MKSIVFKFLITLGIVFIIFFAFQIYHSYSTNKSHINILINQQASLALEFDVAIRKYVAEMIRPVMYEKINKDEFIVEAMSTSFVARSIFEEVRKAFPGYLINHNTV